LLKPLYDKKSDYIEASGTSEESPHSGFPLIENRHGTFMFNVKDLSLIEHVAELMEMNIKNLRIDLRFDAFLNHAEVIMNALKNKVEVFKIDGPRPFIKGFYNINKTDVLFVKLKNNRIARNDANYLAEVVDVEKEINLVLKVKKNLEISEELKLKIITPEGKEKKISVSEFLNSKKEKVSKLLNEKIVTIPYVNGVTVKSQIYLDSSI
jgi:putative protease